MDLTKLNLFSLVGVPAVAKAFQSGAPTEADTGPPGFGSPPLGVGGLQKEVATGPKTPALILDLLKQMLKLEVAPSNSALTSAFTGAQLTTAGEKSVGLSIDLGGHGLNANTPNYSDLLKALGVPVPAQFDPRDIEGFKKAIADALVSKTLPAGISALLSMLFHLGQKHVPQPAASSSGGVPTATSGPQAAAGTTRLSVTGEKPKPFAAGDQRKRPETRMVGPVDQIQREDAGEETALSKPRPQSSAVPIDLTTVLSTDQRPLPSAIAAVPQVQSGDGTFATGAKKLTDSSGAIEKKIVDALGIKQMNVESHRTNPTPTNERPKPFSSVITLQKAPTPTVEPRVANVLEEPLPSAQPRPEPTNGSPAQPIVANVATPPLVKPRPTSSEDEDDSKTKVDVSLKQPEAVSRTGRNEKPAPTSHLEKKEDEVKQDSKAEEAKPRPIVAAPEAPVAKSDGPAAIKPDDTQTAAVKAKVIDQVQEMVALRGNNRVTIKLQPDDLGTLTVSVQSAGDKVSAQVTASNNHLRDSLHAQRSELLQGIENKGLSLNSFTVGKEPGPEAWQQGQGQGNKHGHDMRQEFARSANVWGPRHDQLAAEPGPSFARFKLVGLDTLA